MQFLALQRVELEHDDVVEAVQLLGGQLEHARIDLDGDHGRGLLGRQRRERAGARANLQHHVVGPDGGGVEEQVEQVQVDQEVLAVLVVRPNARLLEPPHEEGESLTRRGHGIGD